MPRVSSHRSHGSHPYRQSWSPAPASTGHTYSSPSSAPHFLSSAEVINSSCTAVSSSNLPQPELYPYQKGKKVTTSQLDQLLAYFAKNDNPTKEERTILASEVQMSFKALSIWFQNERANVKKGRSRATSALPSNTTPSPQSEHPDHRQSSASRSPSQSPSPEPPKFGLENDDETEDDTSSQVSGDFDESPLTTPNHPLQALPLIRVVDMDQQCKIGLDPQGLLVAQILASMKYKPHVHDSIF